jgi:hypothetical protein
MKIKDFLIEKIRDKEKLKIIPEFYHHVVGFLMSRNLLTISFNFYSTLEEEEIFRFIKDSIKFE